ncbi:hypothetical protein ACJ73_02477 [Blastomyces percursus]|uniref:G-patch domain-containing protein n=1 Tax=Blastomyces percursus TaxID=1658174 RepID=A0A1J9QBD8_9EURO|nr:hypothetical protein ACJ73_02477 [Blastomyces percursus]
MDTNAYLLSQGWSGPGNPLNPNRRPGPHGGLGLTKPILIARKKNTHGLGKRTTHDHTNQWWLRGFEAALKGVSDDGSATPQPDGSGSAASGTSELYRFFVKGEPLEGTIDTVDIFEGKEVKGSCMMSTEEGEKKRKRKRSDEKGADKVEGEERALKNEKRRKKRKPNEQDPNEGGDVMDGGLAVESKEERRRRRKQKKEWKKEKGTTKLEEDSSDARADKKRRKKRQRVEDANSYSLSQGDREEAK